MIVSLQAAARELSACGVHLQLVDAPLMLRYLKVHTIKKALLLLIYDYESHFIMQ